MNLRMAIAQLKTIRKGIVLKDDKRNMGFIIRYLQKLAERDP